MQSGDSEFPEFKSFLDIIDVNRAIDRQEAEEVRKALRELCEIGTQRNPHFREQLATIFEFLAAPTPQQVAPEQELFRFGPHRKKDVFLPRQLASIWQRASKLHEDLLLLRKTTLVKWAVEDLLPGEPRRWRLKRALHHTLRALDQVSTLPAILNKLKKIYFRDRREVLLWDLCKYVKRTTGEPHYNRLFVILKPLNLPHLDSADALRQWFTRLEKKLKR